MEMSKSVQSTTPMRQHHYEYNPISLGVRYPTAPEVTAYVRHLYPEIYPRHPLRAQELGTLHGTSRQPTRE
ncbi:hypothetical protein IG631_18742 [Alternaria alternata]|nr:hypothetical protein IG631_18742 [Alternaria alternata]